MRHSRTYWASIGLWLAGALMLGCATEDPPYLKNQDYREELAISVPADSVLFSVWSQYSPYRVVEPQIYVRVTPSSLNHLEMDLHIVGMAPRVNSRAVLDHMWSGDTLRVWCSEYEPWHWYEMNKDSPAEPWFVAKRIEVALPPGVGFRYLGVAY